MTAEHRTTPREDTHTEGSICAAVDKKLISRAEGVFRFVRGSRPIYRYSDGHRRKWSSNMQTLWSVYTDADDTTREAIRDNTKALTGYQQMVVMEMLYVTYVSRMDDKDKESTTNLFMQYMRHMWEDYDNADERKSEWYRSFRQTTAIPESVRNEIFGVVDRRETTLLDHHASGE